jgi:pyruvate/2-oxoglutarate dehydrogenase complex dihydrolipoamide acyltransferase (E2) component
METGTIASWNKEEGESFGPGDVICSVETDKATVDFGTLKKEPSALQTKNIT